MKIRIGTRGSALAIKQAEQVVNEIRKVLDIECEIIKYKTSGDKILDRNLYEIGGKGLFLKEIEEALIAKEIDIAVHSYKDVPGIIDSRLKIGAVLEREDSRDVLLSYKAKSVIDLPQNAIIGTCAPRRRVQILDIRPDIKIIDLRGNIESRIKKFQEGFCDAIILAGAGLNRLNLFDDRFCSFIEPNIMIPSVGQGVIAIQTCSNRTDLDEILGQINHTKTALLCHIERGLLENLNANCNSPVACYARLESDYIFVDFMFADYDLKFLEKETVSFLYQDYNRYLNIGKEIAEKMLERIYKKQLRQ